MVLLTRRVDNGQWCLPGGVIDPGESISECCQREVFEETGIKVKVRRLIGAYSDPNQIVVYPDGNQFQVVVLCFEVSLDGGELGLSNETTDARYFPIREAALMELFHGHAGFIRDFITGRAEAFIR